MPDFVSFPRGTSFPARLLTAEEREAKQRPRGKVSLVPHVMKVEEIEPLALVDQRREADPRKPLGDMPSPVQTWVKLASRHGLHWQCYRHVVKPTDHRGIRSQRIRTVFYVRVFLPRGYRIMREWASPDGEKWPTGKTGLWRPWRGKMIPERTLSVKEAKEIIVIGEV